MGELSYFLGIEVIRTSQGLHLNQRKYILDLLNKMQMQDAKPIATPMATEPKLVMSGEKHSNPSEYRTLVGSLQYLAFTRPNIAYAVNKLSQFMYSPTSDHWQAAKRVLRYLAGTPTHGLFFSKSNPLSLHAYSDADWAGDTDNYVSTNGYIVYLGKHAVSWSAKKQKGVARSSTEAEYRSVANTASEVVWICSLLHELGVQQHTAPPIYCDNIGATYLCANPVFHSRMKHLALDYHFIRDLVQSRQLRVSHVSTYDQLAGTLTKPLGRARFTLLRDKIGVTKGP
uniref:Retrovirus-related Pol polyprotein from transposon TNT 1-94 n=1 Tax=Noccaea caerulescens TaxID=107243 RepID=A0A1J3K4R5_NOCCA